MRFVLRKAPERQRQQGDWRVNWRRGPQQPFLLQATQIGIDKGRAVDLAEKSEIDQHDKPC
jgi:hypothetical protein